MTNLPALVKAKILITGDSWSQGEWQNNNETYGICHTGINQYLVDAGYEVTNVGRRGNHNLQSLEALRNIDLTKFDHCVFFFSDVLRQIFRNDILSNNPDDMIIYHTNSLISELEKIKKDFNIKITVIGGCGKCSPTIAHSIDYIIPSLSEWLVPKFNDVPYAEGGANWTNILLESSEENSFTSKQKEQWVSVLDNSFEKSKAWQTHPEFFHPDGQHANRHVHKLLTDYLITLWTA